MERIKAKKNRRRKFVYQPRDKKRWLARYGFEDIEERNKRMSDAYSFIRNVQNLAWLQRQTEQMNETVQEFMQKRPWIKVEWSTFVANGGGSPDLLKKRLLQAAHKTEQSNDVGSIEQPVAIVTRKHLTLVCDNSRPVQMIVGPSDGGEAA